MRTLAGFVALAWVAVASAQRPVVVWHDTTRGVRAGRRFVGILFLGLSR